MPTVDEMRIVMDAETARLYRKLTEADRRMAQFQRNTERRLKSFDGYFRGAATSAGLLLNALGTRQLVEYANAWTRTERAVRASEDIFGMPLHSAKELVKFANEARIDVESYTKTYFRTAAAIRDYGHDSSVASKMTTALSMALKLGGAAASEQASVLLQYSQALNKGKLDGDEFRSVMENAPVVVELLSQRLKVGKGTIIEWAREGKLKVNDLVGALTDGAASIERIFKGMPQTVDESIAVLRNSMIAYVGDLDKATGASQGLVTAITALANNIETVGDSALVLGAALLAAFGPRLVASIGSLAVGAGAAAGPLGLIAAIVGGGAAAIGLFGDNVQMSADGLVNLHDVSSAVMEVIGEKLTPMLDQAGALWQVAVSKMQDAMSGLPVSFSDIAAAARMAVNATIGVFMFAARSIAAAFTTLPAAVGEQFVDMANAIIATVEAMVRDVVALLNQIPGVEIKPEIDLGRITNPLAGSGSRAKQAMAAAGAELGRDFVGEFGSTLDGIKAEIMDAAKANAEFRRAMTDQDALAEQRRRAELEARRRAAKLDTPSEKKIDKGLMRQMRKAAKELEDLHRKALEAQGRYVDAVHAEYERDLAKFRDMLQKKLITQQQFDQARADLAIVAAHKMNEAVEKEFAKLREVTDAVAGAMENAFDEFVKTGKFNFSSFARSVIADLAKIAFKMMVMQPLFGASGHGFGLFGSLLGLPMGNAAASGWGATVIPAFAEGGRPPVGIPSIVGEKGPELFIPDVSGRIVPNKSLGGLGGFGGAGGEIVVTVVASPELHASIESTAEGVVARNAPAIVGASVDATRRNLPGMIQSTQRRSL